MAHKDDIKAALGGKLTPKGLDAVSALREKVEGDDLIDFDDALEQELNELRRTSGQPKAAAISRTRTDELKSFIIRRLFLDEKAANPGSNSAEEKRNQAIAAVSDWTKAEAEAKALVAAAVPDWVKRN